MCVQMYVLPGAGITISLCTCCLGIALCTCCLGIALVPSLPAQTCPGHFVTKTRAEAFAGHFVTRSPVQACLPKPAQSILSYNLAPKPAPDTLLQSVPPQAACPNQPPTRFHKITRPSLRRTLCYKVSCPSLVGAGLCWLVLA